MCPGIGTHFRMDLLSHKPTSADVLMYLGQHGGPVAGKATPVYLKKDCHTETMSGAERTICIHGHFYQPPRENPWLETVEAQDSAAPWHDWNERITAECYAPNGAARIVDQQNQIIRILNNYARMSFNFGPTLLLWLEQNARRVHDAIVQADRRSQKRFSGHGSAMAQVYNHVIMPLASTRDRITQICWGIADFRSRFGRMPEGMWLPETAVDLESLDLLARNGIRFTLLAPHQCARIKSLAPPAPAPAPKSGKDGKSPAEPAWIDTANASVDTTRCYLVRLKEGRTINVFFYDGPRSRAIAFEGLLNSGEGFAARLMSGFKAESDESQIVHVATDGESYGHHHRYGEMALAWVLHSIQENHNHAAAASSTARPTNYGEFLEKNPPQFEAEIVANTSWSCAHGIERWRSDCGCSSGRPGWNQKWRTPLREALDNLRDAIAPLFHEAAIRLFKDSDAARNDYIRVVLDRSRESRDAFFHEHALYEFNEEERTRALMLMELERHAMLMYTSCGWFFDDISGIETVQVIAYAGRVLQLAQELFGKRAATLEKKFVERLAAARSNLPEQQDGASVYNRYIRSMQVGLEQVAAHYAISSIFRSYPDEADVFCYCVRRLAYDTVVSGRVRLAVGQALISSKITEAAETVAFAVLHFGDQNITAVVKRFDPADSAAYVDFVEQASAAVNAADFPEVVRCFDRFFDGQTYSLRSLFRDEQKRILEILLTGTLEEVESSLSAIYENQAALLHFLTQSKLPRPEALTVAATFAINAGLRRALEAEPIDAIQARTWMGLAKSDQVTLDKQLLGFIVERKIRDAMMALNEHPEELHRVDDALLIARTVRELPFDVNLWQAQNLWYDTWRDHRDQPSSAEWLEKMKELGRQMRISVDAIVAEEANGNGNHAEPASTVTQSAIGKSA
jgi:alpha-amylase/alpha-mannosidase (GH57 family)